MSPSRIDELLDRYIDARLTPAEKSELEALLLASAEAREAFWTRLNFEGLIEEAVETQRIAQWMTEAGHSTRRTTASQAPAQRTTGLWGRWTRLMSNHPILTAFGAAAVLLLALLPFRPAPIVEVREPTSNGVAVLVSTWNARWDESQPSLTGGAVLPPGRLRLASGVVGIEFYNGARMTLEGPADIELVRVDEVICHAGKLRMHVPHVARNFRVLTAQLDVLDLGTEFGLDATPGTDTEVHVFDGKVAWAERGRPTAALPTEELLAGQAIRMQPGGAARIVARPDEFVSSGGLERLMLEQRQERLRAWTELSRRISEDTRTVLHFDFTRDPDLPRTVRNRAARTGPALDGVVVGSDWSEGRWSGKGAMEFRHPGDRVRVVVPGEFDALTYVTWLRVKTLERMFTSIFLTDSFEPGEPHWQFFEGKIRLGIGDAEVRKPTRYLSARVWLGPSGANYTTDHIVPEWKLDRWIHLAVVMDTARREVSHYIDGSKVSTDEMVILQKLRIGDAELGNWGLPASTDPQPIRNFQGLIDEFTIYGTALSPEEIQSLFLEGQPLPPPIQIASAR